MSICTEAHVFITTNTQMHTSRLAHVLRTYVHEHRSTHAHMHNIAAEVSRNPAWSEHSNVSTAINGLNFSVTNSGINDIIVSTDVFHQLRNQFLGGVPHTQDAKVIRCLAENSPTYRCVVAAHRDDRLRKLSLDKLDLSAIINAITRVPMN